jgi:hypothetical protein
VPPVSFLLLGAWFKITGVNVFAERMFVLGQAVALVVLCDALLRRYTSNLLARSVVWIFLIPVGVYAWPVVNAGVYDRYLCVPVLGIAIVLERSASFAARRRANLRRLLMGTAAILLVTLAAAQGLLTRASQTARLYGHYPFPDLPLARALVA